MNGLKCIIDKLPSKYRRCFEKSGSGSLNSITEIRFRVLRPCVLSTRRELLFLSERGLSPILTADCVVTGTDEISDIISRLCEYSVFSHTESISQGYITILGGHRVGICGSMNSNGKIDIGSISSINIRVANEVHGCAARIFEQTQQNGLSSVLLAGSPLCGKTTLARDFARIISGEPHYKKCTIIDERGEIAAVHGGIPSFDIGVCSDVIDRFDRKSGFEIALRTLSPQVVVCDEIGLWEDFGHFVACEKSGVKLVATAHAGNLNELKKKENIWQAIESGIFDYVVCLQPYPNTGIIKNIYKVV
ncbi:MAG: hypothetical protein RSB78_00350 [Oscillospiraceae bacterium]